jgi:hypothetical protein
MSQFGTPLPSSLQIARRSFFRLAGLHASIDNQIETFLRSFRRPVRLGRSPRIATARDVQQKWLITKQDRRESVGYQYRDNAGEAGQREIVFAKLADSLNPEDCLFQAC